MRETELEYLRKLFTGFSVEKKDYILNTARRLIKIQDDNIYPVAGKNIPHSSAKEFTFLKIPPAYAGSKK